MATASVLLVDIAERIGTITLNRPETRNALDGELIAALDGAVKQLAADPEVKVVVLTGAPSTRGHGGFCSGGDVKAGRGPGTELGVPEGALDGDLARHDSQAAMLLHLMPKPSIAMIGGPAVGAGMSLAGACDLRFASDDAVFSAGFAPHGLAGDYGGSFFWTRIAGTATARRLYLLSERLTAADALALGMVHAVLPAAELRDHVMAVAAQLARIPSNALRLIKENLNEAEDEVERRRYLFASEAENQLTASRAMRERRRAMRAEDGSGR